MEDRSAGCPVHRPIGGRSSFTRAQSSAPGSRTNSDDRRGAAVTPQCPWRRRRKLGLKANAASERPAAAGLAIAFILPPPRAAPSLIGDDPTLRRGRRRLVFCHQAAGKCGRSVILAGVVFRGEGCTVSAQSRSVSDRLRETHGTTRAGPRDATKRGHTEVSIARDVRNVSSSTASRLP